ncbi:hypothetical protein JCM9279_001208 [Rhodotorula babjevae]
MLTRARTATHAVRTARRSSPRPDHTCSSCSSAPQARASSSASALKVARPRPPLSSPIDWSQPSTSKVPYSPSRPFSSTSSSTTTRRVDPAPVQFAPEAPFSPLEAALDSPSPQHRRDTLRHVSKSLEALAASPSDHALSRPTFDAVFSRVIALVSTEPTFAAAVLKRLRDLALVREPRPKWQLSLAQAHAVLAARVEQEEGETALWWQRGVRPTGAGTRGGSGSKMRSRWRYLDECADEYWAAVAARGAALVGAERAEAAALVERYARAVAERMSTSLSAPTDLPLAALSARSFARAFSLLPLPSQDVEPHPDHDASKPLVPLFAHDRPTFLSHLRTLLAHNRLPSVAALRQIVTAHYAERDAHLIAQTSALERLNAADADEAAYAHARSVLDEACAGSSARRGANAGLDALLERRLERVERAEALEREPVLFFVRWLGIGLPVEEEQQGRRLGVDERRDMLSAAMKLWEASQVQGRSEWEAPARRYVRSKGARLLEALVLEATRLEGQGAAPTSVGKERASECLVEAVRMASSYLQHHILVHHATPLLLALTASSHSPPVALDLFETLLTPTEPGSTAPPFTWHANLLPAFAALFFSSTAASSAASPSGRDSALPLRLYLSWTSSGLSFPIGLWPALWRAVGRRGSLAELRRLVNDWEDTGRGAVSARIMRFVLEGASERRVVAPLRILAFFRSRYVARPGASPSPLLLEAQPYLVVPLEGYEAVLEALAASRTDRRRAMGAVWRWMTLDGHANASTRAYKALIRAHISRPAVQFSLDDLDKAGLVYNALVAGARRGASSSSSGARSVAAARPDGDTFALLVRGFARVAAGAARDARRSSLKRRIALEAGRRTLDAAVERGLHVPGVETALLVRLLARAGRFEEAKTAQERWWRSVVALEGDKGTKAVCEDKVVTRGMREMRWARTEAELIEARRVARRRKASGGRAEDTALEEEEVEDDRAAAVFEVELEPVLRASDTRT